MNFGELFKDTHKGENLFPIYIKYSLCVGGVKCYLTSFLFYIRTSSQIHALDFQVDIIKRLSIHLENVLVCVKHIRKIYY